MLCGRCDPKKLVAKLDAERKRSAAELDAQNISERLITYPIAARTTQGRFEVGECLLAVGSPPLRVLDANKIVMMGHTSGSYIRRGIVAVAVADVDRRAFVVLIAAPVMTVGLRLQPREQP